MRGMAKQQLPSEMKVLAGRRLRAARLALGVQSEKLMAEKLKVSSNAYNNYECGARLVDVAMAVRLLELTGIGPDWIYAGSTTSVPFDRAQSLRGHLEELERALKSTPPAKPPDSSPPFPGGESVKENQDEDCTVVPLRAVGPQ